MPADAVPRPVDRPPLLVMPAAPSDVPQVAALYLGQDEAARRLYHPLPFRPWQLRLMLRGLVIAQRRSSGWVRWFPRGAAGFLVGRLSPDGPVVAFGHLRFRHADGGVLVAETGYFVAEPHRRQGLGTEFKIGLIAEARRFGAQRVEARIDPENIASIRLNQRLGFTLQPGQVPDRRSPHARLIVAQLELGPAASPPDGAVGTPVDASQRARV